MSSVAAALKDPKGAFRDDVLATVWILSNYEVGSAFLPTLVVPLLTLYGSYSWGR